MDKVNISDLVIETPLCEVFFKGVSRGFYNEYTVRNIQLAVKEGRIENKFHFMFEGSISMINDETFRIEPQFKKGFFNLNYDLTLKLML